MAPTRRCQTVCKDPNTIPFAFTFPLCLTSTSVFYVPCSTGFPATEAETGSIVPVTTLFRMSSDIGKVANPALEQKEKVPR